MKKNYIILFLFFFASAQVQSQVLVPDSLFGNNSIRFLDIGGGEELTELLMQPDSNIIVGGFDYDISVNAFFINMARIDVCGNRDITFGDSGFVRHTFSQRNTAHDFALQQDEKILVVGTQAPSNAGSQQIPYIARFNTDGQPDTTFASTGSNSLRFDVTSSGSFFSVYQMDDGRLLAIGRSSGNINGGVNGVGAMRFLPDGSLDGTFDGDGITRNSVINPSTVVQGHLLQSGRIVTVSFYFDPSFLSHFAATAFDSTGAIDSSFATNALFTDTVNLSLRPYSVMQQDNKIVMAAQREPATEGIEIVRIDDNGALDLTYGNGGHVNLNISGVNLKGIRLMQNDYLLVMGELNPPSAGIAIMLTSDGLIDSTFGINGVHNFDLTGAGGNYLNDMITLPGNRLLGAGIGNGQYALRRYSLQSNVPYITYVHPNLTTQPASAHQWYLNGSIIPGATLNTFDPVVNGDYNVEITDDLGCTYMSDTFTMSTVGIVQAAANEYTYGPNPVKDELVIKSKMPSGKLSVTVCDAFGKKIETYDFAKDDEVRIRTDFLIPGVYLVYIFDDLYQTTLKVIRQ